MEETYRPIIDKAKEFIDFFIIKYEEICGVKINRRSWDISRMSETTRNHLAYTATELWFTLYTPLGVISLACVNHVSFENKERLNKCLIEKFGLIEIRPYFEYEDTFVSYTASSDVEDDYLLSEEAVYYIPTDSQQNFTLPPVLNDPDMFIAYRPRMDSVFRQHSVPLQTLYFKLITGCDRWNTSLISNDKMSMIYEQFNMWLEEISKIDDTIPFGVQSMGILSAMMEMDPPSPSSPHFVPRVTTERLNAIMDSW
jgi:hypothetical protein